MTVSAGAPRGRIILCAKSPWLPTIRREHALALSAAAAGHHVVYVERAEDVRSVRGAREFTSYLGRLAGQRPAGAIGAGLQLARRTTLVPGHRAAVWRRIDCAGLAVQLRRIGAGSADTIVVNLPWHWPAVAKMRGVRKVFDLADDWARLIPRRRAAIESLYRRISAQADEIIVAAPELSGVLEGRCAVLVRNAASAQTLAEPVQPAPGRRRLVYLGTLSERFDAALVGQVLHALPGWTLSLYGPCQYHAQADRPGRELSDLLRDRADQVRWHGPVARDDVARVLDAGDVLILPNNPALSLGQDSMKLYDYAARGRPVVCTTLPGPASSRPPFTYECDTADAFAAAVVAAAAEPPERATARRRWAEHNSWSARMPLWLAAVHGQHPRADAPRGGVAECTW